jgi:hypothetical protein
LSSSSWSERLGRPRRPAGGALLGLLLGLAPAASAAPAAPSPYSLVKRCRPAGEEVEFLRTCVELVRRGQTTRLGPGLVALGGKRAVVLHHRRYGADADRVTVRVYGPSGKIEATFPMGASGAEYALHLSPDPGRFLAWVEVDGRGGRLVVLDLARGRIAFRAPTPLDDWEVFSPKTATLLLPHRAQGSDPLSESIVKLEVVGFAPRWRKVALVAGKGEELTQPRWAGADLVVATLRKVGASSGKTVQARVAPPPPPPAPAPAEAASSQPAPVPSPAP